MKEGQLLKAFLDNQPISKVQVAKELGMTKQNLYQLFKSAYLESETKARFEKLFNRSIFTEDKTVNMDYDHIKPKSTPKDVDWNSELIESLKRENVLLRQQLDFLKDKVLVNLDQIADDQYFFASVHQAWQELWLDHIPMKPKVSLHEAKEMIRTRVSSTQAGGNEKNKEVFYSADN